MKSLLDLIKLRTKNTEKFTGIVPMIISETFGPKDLGINYRTMMHWEEKGILLKVAPPGEYRVFSFMEIIWIEFVNELRSTGFSIRQVLALRKLMFDPFDISSGVEEYNQILGLKKNQKIVLDRHVFNALVAPVLKFFISALDTTFIIYPDSTYSSFEDGQRDDSNINFKSTHISISISKLLRSYVAGDKDLKSKFSLMMLSEDEIAVLYYLRTGKLKSLEVVFNDKQQIDLIGTTEEKKVDAESRLLEILLPNGYREIKFKTRAGKMTRFERQKI